MAATKQLSASLIFGARVSLLAMIGCLVVDSVGLVQPVFAGDRSLDEPVIWRDIDDAPIPLPESRDPDLVWDYVEDSIILPRERIMDPIRKIRRIGTLFGGDHVRPAQNINSLGEVPNSSWFTNRIGLYPMTAEEAAKGPGDGLGPSRDKPWVVVSAKTEGVTPGFNIRDAEGQVYVIKFDPKGALGMTTCAGVVSGRVFYAAGYGVPDDATVRFKRSDLVLGDSVTMKGPEGKRAMTVQDIDDILDAVDRLPDGRWFAISSKFLSGKPVGPFNYIGRRKDDSNDRISHQDRRELRGLSVFSAWLSHFDTKQGNTLDMYVGEPGEGHIVHHLIDFASTLGSGAGGPTARYSYEYTVDGKAFASRLFSLGLYESPWRRVERSEELEEVGFLVSDPWDPVKFKPLQPNSSFANRTGADGYWAAKIITAFSDEHVDRIVDTAKYRNPLAASHVARILKERRDKIGRHFFDEIPPLEFFSFAGGEVSFRDLGAERGIYPDNFPGYEVRVKGVDAERNGGVWSDWHQTEEPTFRLADLTGYVERESFLAVEARVRRYDGWSDSITAYLSTRTGFTSAMCR